MNENSKLKTGENYLRENMLCTEIVSDIQNNFCTQHLLPMFCKKKSLWQRFTCTYKENFHFKFNYPLSLPTHVLMTLHQLRVESVHQTVIPHIFLFLGRADWSKNYRFITNLFTQWVFSSWRSSGSETSSHFKSDWKVVYVKMCGFEVNSKFIRLIK